MFLNNFYVSFSIWLVLFDFYLFFLRVKEICTVFFCESSAVLFANIFYMELWEKTWIFFSIATIDNLRIENDKMRIKMPAVRIAQGKYYGPKILPISLSTLIFFPTLITKVPYYHKNTKYTIWREKIDPATKLFGFEI